MATATATDTETSPAQVLDILIRLFGISRTEAARQIGVSRTTLENWLGGVNGISRLSLGAVCTAFGVDANLFDMAPDDAAHWLIDNKPEWLD